MTFDPTKPVRTRDGREARIVCSNLAHADGKSIIGLVRAIRYGTEEIRAYYANGQSFLSETCHLDLVNTPVITERWINVYNHAETSVQFSSRKEADEVASSNRANVLKFVYEDKKLVQVVMEE